MAVTPLALPSALQMHPSAVLVSLLFEKAFPSQTFMPSCVYFYWDVYFCLCSKCLRWAAGLWVMHKCFCLVCQESSWCLWLPWPGERMPQREHLRTTVYYSSQVTESSWALIQVLLCLSAWWREVCYVLLFFTPLGIKEMGWSITFCEVLLGHGSIGTSCTFSNHWWLNPGEAETVHEHELFLFTG